MIASAVNLLPATLAACSQPVASPDAVRADSPDPLPDAAPETPESPEAGNGFAVVFAAALQQYAAPLPASAAETEASFDLEPAGIAEAPVALLRETLPRIEIESYSLTDYAGWLNAQDTAAVPAGSATTLESPVSRPPGAARIGAAALAVGVPVGEPAPAPANGAAGLDGAESPVRDRGTAEPPLPSNLAAPAEGDGAAGLSRPAEASVLGSARPSPVSEIPKGETRLPAEPGNLPEAEVRIAAPAAESSGGESPGREGSGTNARQRPALGETYDAAGALALDRIAHAPNREPVEAPAPSAGRATVQRISSAVEAAAREGRTTLEVKLDPPGLGTLIVRLSGSAHATAGGMQVEIRALRGEARELLQLHANDLKEALGGWEVKIPQAETGAASARTSERQPAWNSHGGHPGREGSPSRQHRNPEDRGAFAGLLNEEGSGEA